VGRSTKTEVKLRGLRSERRGSGVHTRIPGQLADLALLAESSTVSIPIQASAGAPDLCTELGAVGH